MNEILLNKLRAIDGIDVIENELMSRHTTFKIGGPARIFLDAHTKEAIIAANPVLNEHGIRPFILGNGSNLLVSDSGIDGVVLKISCNKISISGTTVSADSGALLSQVAVMAQRNALSGLEFAAGIPGTVGGGLVMNAGAYGGELCDVLQSSTYLTEDGTVKAISNNEHAFGYRTSMYKNNPGLIILSCQFSLTEGNSEDISSCMREFARRRREKQPLEFPSAGSTFKRPAGNFAGALIEQCGLKGFSIGGASVSPKHAGFIINKGGATCDDVLKLIEHIQSIVLKETGIELECEVCRV